uniref:cupin domain-containing protein n=1 Tax=Micromonospora acroterricola TaxID=2202421 RepID=UPI00191C1C8F|nr:cupin domain-containing protein [Micromonospora acroterricola]
MDPLTGLLDGPRARGAFLLRSVSDPPYALRIEDRAPLTVVALVDGAAWLVPDDAARRRCAPVTWRCCASRTPRWARWPGGSATPARTR